MLLIDQSTVRKNKLWLRFKLLVVHLRFSSVNIDAWVCNTFFKQLMNTINFWITIFTVQDVWLLKKKGFPNCAYMKTFFACRFWFAGCGNVHCVWLILYRVFLFCIMLIACVRTLWYRAWLFFLLKRYKHITMYAAVCLEIMEYFHRV